MAKPATTMLLTMAVVALLSVTLHLQAQAVMEEGRTSVLEPGRAEQVLAALLATNLVCRSCTCCVSFGTDPEVCYKSCCYSQSQIAICGCAKCGGN